MKNDHLNNSLQVLGTVAHVLVQDHESHTTEFHQLPYHRFFIMLLTDLTTSDPVFEAIIFPVLQAFGYAVSIEYLVYYLFLHWDYV